MLPFAMHYLCSRIMEELDILRLTERLLQGKGGDSSVPTPKEKLDTWEWIKILSMIDTCLISSCCMACHQQA
jgi:peroxin-3